MTRVRKPFVPSRQCPHRWCRPAHRWIGWSGTVLMIASFIENPVMESVALVFSVIVAAALLTSRMGFGTHGRVAHQTAGADGSAETEVVVDRRWANIAAACDVLMCFFGVVALSTIGSLGSGAYKQSHGIPPFMGWALMCSAAVITFVFYAHWRATRPRPRRRVRVWIKARIPAMAAGR